ncbi:MAG: 50S ribosomal protein L22 [Rhabdochlamydiaceae bacterium]|nr:50S ribosomal protein L22 [Rhabdochlamydiaceae bacterium]
MQRAKSVTKYVRIPPRKARLAADLIRGLSVEDATLQLLASQLKAGRLLEKTLRTAVADAETLFQARRENLMVHEVRVDAGPVLKRAKSKSKGGRVPVMKRTSHFTVVVAAK